MSQPPTLSTRAESAAPSPLIDPVLAVRDLRVEFATDFGVVRAADGVSFDVYPNSTLAVVGETGSGKSVSMLAALGLLGAANVRRVSGEVMFRGRNLLALEADERRRLLGRDISMIFQDPLSSLNPVMRVGDQIAEVVVAHHRVTKAAARQRAVELLEMVEVPEPATRARQYPHEFSGGMRQRVMVAIAIANRPAVLIADEPTTALDVTVQAQLLDLLRRLQSESGAGMVLITHDMGVVAEAADRVSVMYGGRIMESGPTAEVLADPRHPYTAALLRCLPGAAQLGERLLPIPGQPPDLRLLGVGCPFAARCELVREECRSRRPPLDQVAGGSRRSACFYHADVPAWRASRPSLPVAQADARESRIAASGNRTTMLDVRGLVTHFPIRAGVLHRPVGIIRAVDGIDMRVGPGEALGIVGESGCGKTTAVRTVVRLVDATAGEVHFDGTDLTAASGRALRGLRRGFQVVFQDPYSSLNPRLDAAANVAEPLRILGVPARVRHRRAVDLLALVGLGSQHVDRLPAELSGGQRQRVGIARALAPEPKLLVLDEPVSSLDVSVQAQVLNLLLDLRRERDLAFVFVSHDLALVRHLCDRVAVMYLGKVVEEGPVEDVYRNPRHPYTQALLSATLTVGTGRDRVQRIILEGDPPSPAAPPSGCRFRNRCWKATDRCRDEEPALIVREGGKQVVACHYAASTEAEWRDS